MESPAPSPTEDDEDNEVPPTQEDPITPDTKAAEVVPESPMGLPEENMDSVPGEAVEPEGDKGEVAENPTQGASHLGWTFDPCSARHGFG